MVQYIRFIILSFIVVSLYAADRDDDVVCRKKIDFPSLHYIVQKSLAQKIEREQDSLVTQLSRSLKIHDRASAFDEAMRRVRLVDAGIRNELPSLLTPGLVPGIFNIKDILGNSVDLSASFDAVCLNMVRRDRRLSTLFDSLVSCINNELSEKTFDSLYGALAASPSWVLDELVGRLNLKNGFEHADEKLKKVMNVSALHVGRSDFFVSGCFDQKTSRKVQSVSLKNGQANILLGNDRCVTRFFSQGDFLFGYAPHRSNMYDNTHLYIWDIQDRKKCQDLSVPGKIIGGGLSGSYCIVVDSFGLISCFVQKNKKFFSCGKASLKCSVKTYVMFPHTYAYITDKKTIGIGSLDCSGEKPIFSEETFVDRDASALFFLSETELLACRSNTLVYIAIDSESKKISAIVEYRMRDGDLANGAVMHGKFVYSLSGTKKLTVFDPRTNEYGDGIGDFLAADVFAAGPSTIVAYDDENNQIWCKTGLDLGGLLVVFLTARDQFDLQCLLDHSDIIRIPYEDGLLGRRNDITFAIRLVCDVERERRRAALSDPTIMPKEPK